MILGQSSLPFFMSRYFVTGITALMRIKQVMLSKKIFRLPTTGWQKK